MMLFFLIFLACLIAAQHYSAVHAFDCLELKTSLDRLLAEPFESFTWNMTVTNRRSLLIPYLRIRELVPTGLYFPDIMQPVTDPESIYFATVIYLPGRSETTLSRQVALPKRGRYFFRGSSVSVGDFLGLKTTGSQYTESQEIVVKPLPCSFDKLDTMVGGFLGDYHIRTSLFEDPILTKGFRDYTGREPFRSISWSQSAKHNRLLVKEMEHMADLSCTLLLNTASGTCEQLEKCYSMTRSVAESLEGHRVSFDFYTNGVIAGSMGNWSCVGYGQGRKHLETVLEGLGRMTYDCNEPDISFIRRISKSGRRNRGLILVTPIRSKILCNWETQMKSAGFHVLIISSEEV